MNKIGGNKMLSELFKLAYSLDKKNEYELASEVDDIIKELSQRAGIDPEDMVSLANYFDEVGDVELANKFDSILAKAKKSPNK